MSSPKTSPQNESTIEVEGVTFSYQSNVVLENVSFSLEPGQTLGIVGPNGGGKTTLLKLILGLLPLQKGAIRINGKSPHKARAHIGYMPQALQYDPLYPISVLDIVLMGRLRTWGGYRSSDQTIALRALAQVGLETRAQDAYDRLSGGQRQRVLIARALCCDPDLLLLDEPTANIDLAVEEKLFDQLAQWKPSMTTIMVSHDLGLILDRVTKVLCVNRTANLHAVSELTGDTLQELYGAPLQMIHHHHHHG